MGIRTYTSSIANVAPRLSLRLHELASAGHSAELTKLMDELVIPLYALRAKRKGYEVSAMKAMMDMIGLAGGPVRPPLVESAIGGDCIPGSSLGAVATVVLLFDRKMRMSTRGQENGRKENGRKK